MKRIRGAATGLILMSVAQALIGCGGVQGSRSVSPASMFLPGLIRYEAPRTVPAGEPLTAPVDLKAADRTLPS